MKLQRVNVIDSHTGGEPTRIVISGGPDLGKGDMASRRQIGLGSGTVAGSKDYIIDRIGEFKEAGIAEIMFGGIPSGNVNLLEQFDEEILSAFK